jgi:hypothetical protein
MQDETNQTISCFHKWLSIREENDIPFPNNLLKLRIDMDHSALLRRLLEGKEPLPIPPPRAFSYPWYELIDYGCSEPNEVWEPNASLHSYPCLVIDQFSGWKILDKVSETEWIITYRYGQNQDKWAEGRWRVYQIGSRIPQQPKKVSSNFLWKIEKID